MTRERKQKDPEIAAMQEIVTVARRLERTLEAMGDRLSRAIQADALTLEARKRVAMFAAAKFERAVEEAIARLEPASRSGALAPSAEEPKAEGAR